jgi:hypothetical protein
MRIPHLRLTLQGCSLKLCHLSLVSDPPSSLLTSVIANEQGVMEKGRSTALTERATGWSTTRFSALETDLLAERELQNRCGSRLSIFKGVAGNLNV